MSTKAKRAFITGVFGQDGSYLAEHLLHEGYEVLGLESGMGEDKPYIRALREHPQFSIVVGDLIQQATYESSLFAFMPDEIYNFAAVSDLGAAVKDPERTRALNYEAFDTLARTVFARIPSVRIFQALSSRILVPDEQGCISETSSRTDSENPYDIAKRMSYEQTVLPLRTEGCFIASGFLCNHESPRRGTRFVTGKIADTLARIQQGSDEVLEVGNLESKRDWSFAGDFVRGMHAALMRDVSDDYVFGSGELHTVREFIALSCRALNLALDWSGEGKEEVGLINERELIRINEAFYRPHDVSPVSCSTRLTDATGYTPAYRFDDLVTLMATEAEERVSRGV